MDRFEIEGGVKLKGTVAAGGSKNAALPILIATLLTDETCVISNAPALRDILTTVRLLESIGKTVKFSAGNVTVSAGKKLSTSAPYELVKQMRASVLVAGPLLARFKKASVPLPGGCAIGLRPVDIHIRGFQCLGANAQTVRGDLVFTAKKLSGTTMRLGFPSVGATQNILMCACLVKGKTLIENAALEPEIDDLINFLNACGAKARRLESGAVSVEGVASLHGATYSVMPDRIEAGTYLLAGAITGGAVTVTGCVPEHFRALTEVLAACGCGVKISGGSATVKAAKHLLPCAVDTAPYPAFPTDLQAPLMALACVAGGTSRIKESIFENRFMHAPELARMGALIAVDKNVALVEGVKKLSGACVMASDLRGGAALVLAALAAKGASVVDRVYHIDRGYERMEKRLSDLGAKIKRTNPSAQG